MFSIIIPTFNNLEYLKLCIQSIKKIQNLIMKSFRILMKELMVQKNI
jgi:glycosyltransferase involved in cell wall biosynthesis